MSELDGVIKELREIAASITETADWLLEKFSDTEAGPELKLEDVRAVLADASRKGYTAQVRELLRKYGAEKLSDVDPAQYQSLLHDVEGLSDAE